MVHETVKSDIRMEAQTSSARRMQVIELSYPVEEASPPSRGWSTDAPSMYPELQ